MAGRPATPVGLSDAIDALTGDVVAAGPGSAASTIQPNVVGNTKLAQMAAGTVKANITTSTANAADVAIADLINSAVEDAFLLMGG